MYHAPIDKHHPVEVKIINTELYIHRSFLIANKIIAFNCQNDNSRVIYRENYMYVFGIAIAVLFILFRSGLLSRGAKILPFSFWLPNNRYFDSENSDHAEIITSFKYKNTSIFFLFDLIFYVSVNNLSVMSGRFFLG